MLLKPPWVNYESDIMRVQPATLSDNFGLSWKVLVVEATVDW